MALKFDELYYERKQAFFFKFSVSFLREMLENFYKDKI